MSLSSSERDWHKEVGSVAAVAREDAVQRLVLVRESDVHGRALMRALVDQTCRMYRDVPGVATALEARLGPLEDPGAYGAVLHRDRHNRAVVFLVDGTLFLYWMGSAALEARGRDDVEENAFSAFVSRLIVEYQPEELLLATFSRLVRSEEYGARVRKACIDAEVTIRSAEAVLSMAHEAGQMYWTLLAMTAAAERRRILQRLLLGLIADAREGKAPFGNEQLPPGYQRGPDKRVRADEGMREKVRGMLEILADDGMYAREKVERIAELGVTRQRVRRLYGEDAGLDAAKDVPNVVRNLLGWVPLYETGQWRTRRECPITGVEEFGDLPVLRDEQGRRVVELVYDWGLPEGGWGPPELFDALRQRLREGEQRRLPGGGAAHRRRKPLAGLAHWSHRGWGYGLYSDGRGRYLLKRHQPGVAGRRDAEHIDPPGEAEGVAIDAGALHTAVAEACVRAVSDGSAVELRPGVLPSSEQESYQAMPLTIDEASRRRSLEQRLAELDEEIARTIDLASRSGHERVIAAYHDRAETAAAEAERLRGELEAPTTRAAQPDTLVFYGREVLAGLANLANLPDSAPREVGEALSQVLAELRFDVDELGDPAEPGADIGFSCTLHLPGDAQVIALSGIRGRVPVQGVYPRGRRLAATDRWGEQALAMLREGTPLDQLPYPPKARTQKGTHRQLAGMLRARGLSSHQIDAAVGHPCPHARAVITQLLLDDDVDGDYPHAWLQRMRDTYTGGALAALAELRRAVAAPQAVLDLLAEVGQPMPRGEVRHHATAVTAAPSRLITRMLTGSSGRVSPLPPLLEASHRGPGVQQTLSLRTCPRCDTPARTALRLPEIAGLLCQHCDRFIDQPDLVLPPGYDAQPPLGTSDGDRQRVTRGDIARAYHDGKLPEVWTNRQVCEITGADTSTVADFARDGVHGGWVRSLGSYHDHDTEPDQAGMPPEHFQITATPYADAHAGSAAAGGNQRRLRAHELLVLLPDSEFTTIGIARDHGLRNKSVTKALVALRSDGLVEARRCPDHSTRGYLWQLTDRGRRRRDHLRADATAA